MCLLIFRNLLLLIILTTSSINSGLCFTKNSRNSTQLSCRDEDREALLKIKLSLSDPFNSLQSWELSEGADCCKWKGVSCDAASGHVIKLELLPHMTYLEDFEGESDLDSEPSLVASELSPHLLELKHLNHLDLTGIRLVNATSIPEVIGWMKQLRYLNLSNVGFDGEIPHVLGNLTNLEVLDLSGDIYASAKLYSNDVKWVSSLVALKYLDLTRVNLTRTSDVVLQVLGVLPSLSHLALSGCGLETSSMSHRGRLFNSTPLFANLQYLDLSHNEIEGEVPSALRNMTALKYLDLSGNNLVRTRDDVPQVLGVLPSLSHLALSSCGLDGSQMLYHGGRLFNPTPLFANLQYLDISDNEIQGEVPSALRNMTSLKYLDLSENRLARTLDDVLQLLGVLPSLSHLALSSCELDGSLTLSHGGQLFNSTLLAKLQYLDLSRNWIEGEVPSWLRNMTEALTYLDLSRNHFNSSIPIWFDNFESLVHLDLSVNDFDKVEGGLSHFVRGKCNLRYLYLNFINQYSEVEIGGNYSSTATTTGFFCGGASSKLEILSAMDTRFKGNHIFDLLEHLQNLTTLVITGNSFSVPIPDKILATLTGLRHLVLEDNQLEGTLDANALGKLTNLVELDLSENRLEGEIPQLLFANMLQLRYLSISHNKLQGKIHQLLFANMLQLNNLDISNNQLQGEISQLHFANLSRLRYLDVSNNNKLYIDLQQPGWVPPFQLLGLRMRSCNFRAQFPWWIQTQNEARMLDLSNASISGEIPQLLFANMLQLQYLDISNNQLQGEISQLHFANLGLPSKLTSLDISHNQLSGAIQLDFKEKLPGLHELFLNDNQLSGSIPTSLCYLESLDELDLSANHFSGTVPDCWNHSSNRFIDLSSNKLSGNIPISLGNLQSLESLHLNNNNLYGEIPFSMGTLQKLGVLDLGENNLSGNLPAWIGQNLTLLQDLRLRSNHLTGDLPVQICSLSHLAILDLGWNNLGGHIPHCLGHMRAMTLLVTRLPISPYDRMIMLTKGLELEYTTNLRYVQALDLSSNKFVGSIPANLTLLIGLHSLNLSHNFLSGNIPKNIGDMKKLESLDLSNNQLSGSVPSSISSLASLSHFNLSNNNLQGRVPSSTQLDTLDDLEHSIYAGNPLLCGEQLSKKCPGDHDEQVPSPREEDDDVSEKLMLYISVMLGFMTGFGGVVVTLVLNRTWRAAYFNFVEDVMGSVYVVVKVKVNKIKRRMGGA